MRKQAEEGDKKAAVMLKLAESPNDFLSTIQVCITLSGFLASAFAADHFATRLSQGLVDAGFTLMSRDALNTLCLIVITLVLSYFTLVLGELAPKRIAMQKPRENRPHEQRRDRRCPKVFQAHRVASFQKH